MAQKRAYSLNEDDTEVFEFLKKVKVEHETISSIIRKKHPKIDVEEHELSKFLAIFNAVLESNLDDQRKKTLTLKTVLLILSKS